MTDELHKLGDVLRSAREAKGVDLARVERDTKIRSRYLAALEHGEYRDLPGPVYTKGFLRNYGVYLGLDPEYLTDLYRLETNGTFVERSMPAAPRPIAVRRSRALVVTPGAIAAAFLTVAVVAFIGYLAYEFVTFARTPDLRVIDPASDVAGYTKMEYTISGVTEPNSRITVDGLRENPVITADATGHFSVQVKLVPGSNVITLVASDPLTQRDSAKVTRTINVDVTTATPTPGTAVALSQPAAGATVSAALAVHGTAPAGTQVTISARLVTPGAPGFTITTAFGQKVAVPMPRAGLVVTAKATATAGGDFNASLAVAPGLWELKLTPGDVTRRVTVRAAAGLHGTLAVAASPSYVKLVQDGVPAQGISGRTLARKSVPLKATRTIVVLAGNAASVTLTINGIKLPVMGDAGAVVEWRIST